ncbi:hypothetical protein HMPREF9592_01060 [Cutibacterium acnes HL046PA1]|nr:hypothetical protein HMPREF9567_00634 [Cutibacterium acnes HL013PA1]EFS59219.1 hypothetical protein HMPREF9604_00828 [Cutibacterium acnes HL036PA1]EFT74321.1 hypothetical protein HMPREF9592_01060 [Cutibacterium acnes HL046PA1]EGF02997.1 hypothetical protein HMPREF9586_00719 [Cutibacterium acnes HL083PA2]
MASSFCTFWDGCFGLYGHGRHALGPLSDDPQRRGVHLGLFIAYSVVSGWVPR